MRLGRIDGVLTILVAAATLLLFGCSDESPAPAATARVAPGDAAPPPPPLRVLLQRADPERLPRQGNPLYLERELVEQFAQGVGRELQLTYLDEFADLLPALVQGRGDLVLANLTITPERREQVDFTLPVAYSRQQLVLRAGATPPQRIAELAGLRLGVQSATAFYATALELQQKVPDLQLVELPPDLDTTGVLDQVAAGEVDLTIEDSNLLEVELPLRDDLQSGLAVSELSAIAWALRKGDETLLAELNRFLTEHHFLGAGHAPSTADLTAIKARGTLRLLTHNNSASYYLLRGELLGFEYELVKRFAEQQGLLLEVVVVEDHAALFDKLLAGEGDLAAASLTPTAEREGRGIAFSRPYLYSEERLVARADDPIERPEQLAGRSLWVRPSSSYRQTLEALQAQGVALHIEAVPETLETEQVMARVASGEYDLTLADSHLVAIEQNYRDDLRSPFALGPEQGQAWAVRADNPELLAAVNAFHAQMYRGTFYNITYKKYFDNPRNIQRAKEGLAGLDAEGRISPYDELFRQEADKHDFDWRLILAQAFQESRFDPAAKSWVGAKGLLQVMPNTAKELGVKELGKPENGVRAGVAYLAWVRERFEDSLPLAERIWFSLAAYNAGAGHVQDARRLAQRQGWDANQWFGHVEQAMLLLGQREYAKQARYGYVRGEEPVTYVRNIRDLYRAYSRLLDLSGAPLLGTDPSGEIR